MHLPSPHTHSTSPAIAAAAVNDDDHDDDASIRHTCSSRCRIAHAITRLAVSDEPRVIAARPLQKNTLLFTLHSKKLKVRCHGVHGRNRGWADRSDSLGTRLDLCASGVKNGRGWQP